LAFRPDQACVTVTQSEVKGGAPRRRGEVTNSIGNVCRRSIKLWELEQLENNVSNFLLLLFFAATVSDRE
jgi:hypothetical protein